MSISIQLTAECAARVIWNAPKKERFLPAKIQFVERLVSSQIRGVIDVVPGMETVLVSFDPAEINFDRLKAMLLEIDSESAGAIPSSERTIDLPVCYDDEFGLDLEALKQQLFLTVDQIIQLHLSGDYTVSMIGFSPGFPYLSGLTKELHASRKATPRTYVPAGSVGIGGSQTGIYSIASPGGWNILGRTPISLFWPDRFPPTLLKPGDRVRFFRISVDEFHTWTSQP